MTRKRFASVVRYLHRATVPGTDAERNDGVLLAQFADHGDEAAFAVLLRRHGPMVLGVCRRLLGNGHDAEDAFQATFLILLRRARALERRPSLSSWLYTVACHLSMKMRAGSARQKAVEEQTAVCSGAETSNVIGWEDVRPVIDQELQRLPAKFRDPVVLCYLEGRTNEEAAQELRWPVGTVKGRLAQARDLLRTRLIRRGIVLSAAVLNALQTESAAATLPPLLTTATLRAASGVVSPPVAALVKGMARAMWFYNLKIAAAVVIVLGAVGAGSSLATYHAVATQAAPVEEAKTPLLDKPPAGDKEKTAPAAEEPKGRSDLAKVPSLRDGVIDTIAVKQGDEVKKGQVLAQVHHLNPPSGLTHADLEIAKVKVEIAEIDLRMTKNPDTDKARAALRIAKLEVERIRILLNSSFSIQSKVHGVVKAIYKHPGEMVKAGEPIFLIQVIDESNKPYLGVNRDPDAKDFKVALVADDSPAAQAGIQVNDVLTKFDRQEVTTFEQLVVLLGKKKVGDEVEVEVQRGDKTLTLNVKLGKRSESR